MLISVFLFVAGGCASTSAPSIAVQSDCSWVRRYGVAWLTNKSAYLAKVSDHAFEVISRSDDIPYAVERYFSHLNEAGAAPLAETDATIQIQNEDYFRRGPDIVRIKGAAGGEELSWNLKAHALAVVPIKERLILSLEESRRDKRSVRESLAAAIGHPIPSSDIAVRVYKFDGEFVCEMLVASDVEYLSRGGFVLPVP